MRATLKYIFIFFMVALCCMFCGCSNFLNGLMPSLSDTYAQAVGLDASAMYEDTTTYSTAEGDYIPQNAWQEGELTWANCVDGQIWSFDVTEGETYSIFFTGKNDDWPDADITGYTDYYDDMEYWEGVYNGTSQILTYHGRNVFSIYKGTSKSSFEEMPLQGTAGETYSYGPRNTWSNPPYWKTLYDCYSTPATFTAEASGTIYLKVTGTNTKGKIKKFNGTSGKDCEINGIAGTYKLCIRKGKVEANEYTAAKLHGVSPSDWKAESLVFGDTKGEWYDFCDYEFTAVQDETYTVTIDTPLYWREAYADAGVIHTAATAVSVSSEDKTVVTTTEKSGYFGQVSSFVASASGTMKIRVYLKDYNINYQGPFRIAVQDSDYNTVSLVLTEKPSPIKFTCISESYTGAALLHERDFNATICEGTEERSITYGLNVTSSDESICKVNIYNGDYDNKIIGPMVLLKSGTVEITMTATHSGSVKGSTRGWYPEYKTCTQTFTLSVTDDDNEITPRLTTSGTTGDYKMTSSKQLYKTEMVSRSDILNNLYYHGSYLYYNDKKINLADAGDSLSINFYSSNEIYNSEYCYYYNGGFQFTEACPSGYFVWGIITYEDASFWFKLVCR